MNETTKPDVKKKLTLTEVARIASGKNMARSTVPIKFDFVPPKPDTVATEQPVEQMTEAQLDAELKAFGIDPNKAVSGIFDKLFTVLRCQSDALAQAEQRAEKAEAERDAWKSLSVTAIAAENLNVSEYLIQLEYERVLYRRRYENAALYIPKEKAEAENTRLREALKKARDFTEDIQLHTRDWNDALDAVDAAIQPASTEQQPASGPTDRR
jgi:hypothetical protein